MRTVTTSKYKITQRIVTIIHSEKRFGIKRVVDYSAVELIR